MMECIRSYAIKISLACIILLLFTACKDNKVVKEYYYEIYQNMDSIPHNYQAVKIIDRNDIRKQVTYRYNDICKKLTDKPIEYFKLSGTNVWQLNNINDGGKLYLSTEYIDSCITYAFGNDLYDIVASTTHCFRGRKRLKQSNGQYITSYEFTKTFGLGMDNVSYSVFYDMSFVPIKAERIAGYSPIDRINRINSIPSEFESLLNKEVEWTQH